MRTPTRRGAVVGAVAALVALAGTAAPGVAAADTTAPPTYVSGWLALQTGSTNAVRLVNSGGVTLKTQRLSTNTSCAMSSTGAALLGFTADPSSPGVGLNSGAIGVRENANSNGTSCSAVDSSNGESLFLSPGADTSALLGSGKRPVFSSASLDLDLKQNVDIIATPYLNGSPVTDSNGPVTFELQSGDTINTADIGNPRVFQCNNPSDSGPDANTQNNCRWPISEPSWLGQDDGIAFDSLKLTPVVGSFSLMGGADGPVGSLPSYITGNVAGYAPSVFELVEGTLTCGDTATLKSSSAVPASTWKRLDNLSTSACAPYPYATSTGTDAIGPYAHFVKPFGTQALGTEGVNSQAVWTSTFVYKGTVPSGPLFAFDQPGVAFESLQFQPLAQCSADQISYDSSTGTVQLLGGWSPPLDAQGNYACLLTTATTNVKGTKTVTWTAYVVGDAGMRL